MTGNEIARYLNAQGALISVRDDGTTWAQTMTRRTFFRYASKKPEVALDVWQANKLSRAAERPTWACNVKSIPTLATLERWIDDGICKTPSGHRVEPDGHGPDGSPSWLLVLGYI